MNTLIQSRSKDLLLILGLGLFLGIISLIKIPLPVTPVPIAFTAQAVLLFAVLFGRKGAYSTLTYLAYGAMGLPVLAGGSAGFIHFMGPTGGYLLGYAVAAFVVAILSERLENKTPAKIFAIMLLGNALIFTFGVPYLALFVGGENALKFGLYPFIGGDLLKVILAMQILRKVGFLNRV